MFTKKNNHTNIAIADSDLHFKKTLIDTIEKRPSFNVSYNCANGLELINQLYKKQEDIFLIDLFMPVMTGIEAIRIIRNKDSHTPILAYSNTYQEDISKMLNNHKNTYYCQKNINIILDITSNYILTNKKTYTHYALEWKKNMEQVHEYIARQQNQQHIPTVVELQIMRLACEGYTNSEIGKRINLSPRTIDGYIKKLTLKMGVKNKIQLITYCVENGYHNLNL